MFLLSSSMNYVDSMVQTESASAVHLHQEGIYYVLFCGNDDSKMNFVSVNTHTVEHVEIKI